MQQHLACWFEVTVGVVEDRNIEQRPAVAGDMRVVGHLQRSAAGGRCTCGQRVLRPGLVVGRVTQEEGGRVSLVEPIGSLPIGLPFEDRLADLVGAQGRQQVTVGEVLGFQLW